MQARRTIVAIRAPAAVLALVAALCAPLPAAAAPDAGDVLVDLAKMNTKAVAAYRGHGFREARKILERAAAICAARGLDKSPLAARTHLHLGIVLLTGFKEHDRALAELRAALAIQPDIKLGEGLSSPEIDDLLGQAAQPPAPPPPAPPPTAPPPPAPESAVKGDSGDDSAPPPEPIAHVPVQQAPPGRAIPIEVKTAPSLAPAKVVLAFRAYDAADFDRTDMREVSPGQWAGEIRQAAVRGDEVAYYVEAQNAGGEPIAYKGSASEPLVVTLALERAGAPEATARAGGADSDQEEEDDGSRWFVALAVGSGGGWTRGSGEVTPRGNVGSGQVAPAELGHVAPEIGYFVRDGFMLSAQLRLQYVTGTTPQNAPAGSTDCGSDGVCNGATAALAGFLRATWLWGEASLHPYLAATAGGGTIRHVVRLKNVSTCGDAAKPVPCVDTVAAGPVFAGAGAGLIFNATDTVGLTLGLNALVGFPTFTAHVDLNGGVTFQF